MNDDPTTLIKPMEDFFSKAPTAAIAPLEDGATEEQSAVALRQALGLVRCHANQWRIYEEGSWRELDASTIDGKALAILAPTKRASRRAGDVVKHLRMLLNADGEPDYATFAIQEPGRMLLNCQNAVVAVSADKIEVLPHSSTYNFTQRIETAWDAAAECPTFRRALKEMLPDLADATLFLLFCGYSLMNDCRFQCCLLMVGPGATGKSTLLKTIQLVLGPRLVAAVGLSQLCDFKTFALPELKDKALNIAPELDAKVIEASSTFKALVCGEVVPDRRAFHGYKEMITHCKLLFATNSPPYFAHCTDAEPRRLRILACDQKVAKIDVLLPDKLAQETPGILRLMVGALQELLVMDAMPEGGSKSRKLAKRYRETATPVETFSSECCEFDSPTGVVSMKDTFDEFTKWAKDTEGHFRTQQAFHKDFQRLHPELERARRRICGEVVWCYVGLQFRSEL